MHSDTAGGVVGRERELGILDGLWSELAAGRGRAVLVEGEPGIGKTALVAAGLAAAAEAGFPVSRGSCDQLGQKFPLSVLMEALDVDGRSAGRRQPQAATGPAERGWSVALVAGDPVMAAVEQLLVLVDQMCAAGPLVLAVDDLQWADEASLLVWQQLCRATAQLPLLLVGTCRPVPRRAELDLMRRDLKAHGAVVIPLAALTPDEVAQLVRRLMGGSAGPRLLRRLELAAGNPLYVRELLDVLVRARAVAVCGGIAELTGTAAAADQQPAEADEAMVSLAAAISDRLDYLSADTREVLRTAALLGTAFSVPDLSGVLGRSAARLTGAVEEALAAGVLEAAGTRLRFRHGLLKQALYEAIPGPLRVALYRDAARALMAAGSPVERVAELLLARTEAADGWELEWLADNAAALVQRAPAIAAELFERALSHTHEEQPWYVRLEDHLAAVAFLLARNELAERCARRILSGSAEPGRRGRASWILGYTLLRARRVEDALSLTAQACADPRIPPVWQARLAALHAIIVLDMADFAEAAEAAVAAVAAGERLADPMATGYALHTLSMTRFVDRDKAGCIEAIDRALALIGTDPELIELRLLLYTNRISALGDLDRFTEAAQSLRQARALAERTGNPRLGTFLIVSAVQAYDQGDWDDALAEIDAISAPAHQTYLAPILDMVRGMAALIAGHRDDSREADRYLCMLLGEKEGHRFPTVNAGYLMLAKAGAAERAGRPDQAVAALAVLFQPGYEKLGEREMVLPVLVRLALDAGDPDTARRAARLGAAEARERPVPRIAAAAHWCRGLLDADPAPVLAAADYFRSTGRRIELGNALEDAAALLARGGDPAAARAALTEAVSVYAGLGAAWDSRRAVARLRPGGVRPDRTGARRRPQTGWAALTETERRIAEELVHGYSNPDIAARLLLSRRTVETHVSHILAKLQARSRREVAELAGQRTAGAAEPSAAGPAGLRPAP